MRYIKVVELLGYFVVIESAVKNIEIGDILTSTTIFDLFSIGIPVLSK